MIDETSGVALVENTAPLFAGGGIPAVSWSIAKEYPKTIALLFKYSHHQHKAGEMGKKSGIRKGRHHGKQANGACVYLLRLSTQ